MRGAVLAVGVLLAATHANFGWGFKCPPPPPPANGQMCAHGIPFARADEGHALFLGTVTEIFPESEDHYKRLWEGAFGETLSGDWERTPENRKEMLAKFRLLVLGLWRDILLPDEEGRVLRAATLDELGSSFDDWGPFQRRVRLDVLESFAGELGDSFELYTGFGGGDHGVGFRLGETWIVSAYRSKESGRWVAGGCGNDSRPPKTVARDLDALRAQRLGRPVPRRLLGRVFQTGAESVDGVKLRLMKEDISVQRGSQCGG